MVIEDTQFKLGTTGESIIKLHRRLSLLGISVPMDELREDRFGPGTTAAIRRFQAIQGLPVHGMVDAATARGLGLGGYPTSITGLVCRPDGVPLPDVAVQLVQNTGAADRLLGETRSDASGKFSLPWPVNVHGGLVVRTEGSAGATVSWKTDISSDVVWVRLSVGGEYRGASRYALLDAALAPAVGDAAFQPAANKSGLRAIAQATGVPEADVSRHVLAHKLAIATKLEPAVWFALLAQDPTADLQASRDPEAGDAAVLDDAHVDWVLGRAVGQTGGAARIALEAAIANNVVGEIDVDAVVRQFQALRVEHIGGQPLRCSIARALSEAAPCCASGPETFGPAVDAESGPDPVRAAYGPLQVGRASLRAVLATSLGAPAAQRAVLEAFAALGGDAPLGAVVDAAADLAPEQRAEVRFTLEAAALLGNHLPLVERVQQLRASGKISRASDLARLDAADWAALLLEADPGAEHIVPATNAKLAAAPVAERIAHVAGLLATRLEASYPTAALAGRLAKDAGEMPLAAAREVGRWLDLAPSFCIRHSFIDSFVQEASPDLLSGLDDGAAVVADLKTLQRAYKLSPRFDHARAMLAAGHHSAYSVYSAGPERFAAQMAVAGVAPDEATAMFAQAEQVHATALTLMANFHGAFTSATPLAVAQPIANAAVQAAVARFPTLQSLFGSNDYCACADCRSIHGPAAYFVDMLEFLKSRLTPDTVQGPSNSYPVTAAQVSAAVPGATFTHGWLCDEVAGNLVPAFGGVTLTASGAGLLYGDPGPRGGDDRTVGFTARSSGRFDGGALFDIGLTDELVVAWVGKWSALPTAFGTMFGNASAAFGNGWSMTGTDGNFLQLGLGPGSTFGSRIAGAAPFMVGRWHVGIAVIDRTGTATARFGVRELFSSNTVLSTPSTSINGQAASSASHFTIGSGDWVSGNSNFRLAALYVGKGPGVASGLATKLSPALAQFASRISGGRTNARDIVLGRRPDLSQIELSCANTNGVVPYVDLVCEILEDAVAAPASSAVRARQTSGTAEERRANPAFVNSAAYQTLRAARFPITAPFDLFTAEVRAFLGQLGVARHELMAALQAPAHGGADASPTDTAIAGERLGFNTSALALVTDASPAQPWTLWNLGQDNQDPDVAVSFVAASPVLRSNGAPLVLETPSATQPGDTLLCFVWSGELLDTDLNTSTLPSGWSLLSRIVPETRQAAYLFRRVATGSEPVTHTFAVAGRGAGWPVMGLIVAYRGLDTSAPLVDAAMTNVPASVRPYVCPSLTLTSFTDLYLAFVADHTTPGLATGPVDMAKRADAVNSGVHCGVFDMQPFAMGATGTRTVTLLSPSIGVAVAYAFAKSHNAVPDPRNPDPPVLKSGSWLDVLSYVPILLDRAGLQHRELVQLLQTRFVNPGGKLAIVEDAATGGFARCDTGLQNIRLASGATGTAWTADLLTGLNRFIRLWRQLGCTIWDLDKMLSAPAIGNGAIDAAAIRQLGRLDAITARLPGPRDELLTLWDDIDHVDYLNVLADPEIVVPSVYRRLFRNATVAQASTAFVEDATALSGTLGNADVVAGISAALGVSAGDIQRIRTATSLSDGSAALSLANLSTITRYAILARRLELSIPELLTAIAVTGVNPFPSPLTLTATLQFLTALDQVRDSGFSLLELNYLLRHDAVIDSGIGLTDTAITAWLHELRRDLVRGAAAGPDAAADLVVQRLSAALPLDPMLTEQVLQSSLPDRASTMASFFTAPALTAQTSAGALATDTTRTNFSAIYDAYTALDKLRIVLARWRVSTANALWLLQHAAGASWLELHTLPVSAAAAQRSTATLAKLDVLRRNIVVQQTLASTSGTRLFDVVLAPGATVEEAASKLAELGGWQSSDIVALASQLQLTTAASLMADATAARIRDAMAWPRRLGTDVPTALSFVTASVGSSEAGKARQLAMSRFTREQWLGVAGSIQDRLREQKRAALVSWLLANPNSARGQAWATVEDLYGFYLIDPEMSAAAETTRIKQAAASIQLFVQRCLLQLEANMTIDATDSSWKQWEWMKRFRLWEANRKIFLYPENWYDPAQRRDMSPYFAELVAELQQSDLTADVAEDALRAYLHKLTDVAHLEVTGMWQESLGANQSILHVVARTRKTPYVYSYRRREATGAWSPWEPLDVGADTNQVMPAIWNNRLFMLWTEFTEKSLPATEEDRTIRPLPPSGDKRVTSEPRKYWEISLAWLERRKNIWLPKRLSQRKQFITSSATSPRSEIVFRVVTQDRTLTVQAYLPILFPNAVPPLELAWLLTGDQDEPRLMNRDLTALAGIDEVRYVDVRAPEGGLGSMGARPRLAGKDMAFNFNAYGGDQPGPVGILSLQKRDGQGVPGIRDMLGKISQPRLTSVRFGETDQFQSAFFVSDTRRTFFAPSASWALQTFYHPFAETFVQRLNIGGLPGLYDRTLQTNPDSLRGTAAFDFNATYAPTNEVTGSFPTETIDYTQPGSYSGYNWELFLHAPLLIAKQLAGNQRFAEALTWFHYIFDPTTNQGSGRARYWNPRVFRDLADEDYPKQQIEQLLQGVNAGTSDLVSRVADWRANPFDPNLVAASRPVAYQKAVVMQYIATLIGWGDQLFRGDTIESINEATQLYLLASQLLGPRPQNLRAIQPVQNQTYDQLKDNLDAFSNKLVDIEAIVSVPPPGAAAPTLGLPALHTFYFCIPPNDQMLGYWDTVADRLFKIRHGLNLDGVARPLALYDAPIDPGLLTRAVAAGVDISAVLADSASTMCYRFATLWQVAHDLCQDVRGLGSAILSAIERRDGEEMARLRATQEIAVLDAVHVVKTKQLEEANANRDALQSSRDMAVARRDYYASREFMNAAEIQGEKLNTHALYFDTAGVMMDLLSGITALLPDLQAGASGVGGSPVITALFGGKNLSRNCAALASVLRGIAGIKSRQAGMSTTFASYQRRAEDWDHQRELADKEIGQIDKQLIAADIRIAIAQQEIDVHQRQIADAKANAELLQAKFSNKELYDWMVSQLSSTYFQAYQLAYDLARRASKAYAFELGIPDPGFIQFGYWDSLHKGLVTGDKLLLDLRRLQVEHLNQNTREFELTKHVSLLQLDPAALATLRRTGECRFALTEELFDLDQPGHYYRRLKTVSVTLPCVTGPYTAINATLTLESHTTRISKTTDGGYLAQPGGRFTTGSAAQWIAVSTGREDAGLFEVNFHDDRYLPFEKLGAVSQWHLELPRDTNRFDLTRLNDVVLHVRYTARDGGPALRDAARQAVTAKLPRGGLLQLFSAQTEFPDAFARLLSPTGAGQRLDIALGSGHFPYVPTSQQIRITGITALLVFASDKTYTAYANAGAGGRLAAHIGVTPGDGTPPSSTALFTSDPSKYGGIPAATVASLNEPIGPLSVAVAEADLANAPVLDKLQPAADGTSHHRLNRDLIDDILIVVTYQIAAKS